MALLLRVCAGEGEQAAAAVRQGHGHKPHAYHTTTAVLLTTCIHNWVNTPRPSPPPLLT
jgi:hypothetical protein